NGQRDVSSRNWDASRWRRIENKDGAGLPRREEKERGFQESHGKVRIARRSFGRNNSHKQRGVGTARRGRRERRNSLRTECGQIFCAGFEHEVVRQGAGASETGTGVPLPYHSGNARRRFK